MNSTPRTLTYNQYVRKIRIDRVAGRIRIFEMDGYVVVTLTHLVAIKNTN